MQVALVLSVAVPSALQQLRICCTPERKLQQSTNEPLLLKLLACKKGGWGSFWKRGRDTFNFDLCTPHG